MDDIEFALRVEEVAKIISGAPFPSKQSLAKARQIVSLLERRSVPDGWILMPRVLTEAMLNAGGVSRREGGWAGDIYGAMVTARPEVP